MRWTLAGDLGVGLTRVGGDADGGSAEATRADRSLISEVLILGVADMARCHQCGRDVPERATEMLTVSTVGRRRVSSQRPFHAECAQKAIAVCRRKAALWFAVFAMLASGVFVWLRKPLAPIIILALGARSAAWLYAQYSRSSRSGASK